MIRPGLSYHIRYDHSIRSGFRCGCRPKRRDDGRLNWSLSKRARSEDANEIEREFFGCGGTRIAQFSSAEAEMRALLDDGGRK